MFKKSLPPHLQPHIQLKQFSIKLAAMDSRMDQTICTKPCHDNQRLKYLCVDPECQILTKLGCADCFLDDHVTHIRKTTGSLREVLKEQIKQIENIEVLDPTSTPQKDISSTIDEELELCLSTITQRFSAIKTDLKGQIDQDMQKLADNQQLFVENLKNEVLPIRKITQKDFSQCNQNEMTTILSFHNSADKIMKHYQQSASTLSEERTKVKSKKQKYVNKLRNVMTILLKEFNELMTSKNLQYDENDFETPKKYILSPKKGLSIVEAARQSRRYNLGSNQKRYSYKNS
ncbi:hypothetical protein pb186bvf_002668 [Paramecium bursaria]